MKKKILIIGCGLSGLSAAVTVCENGACALLVSPYTSERAQSVMAAGGMNAALDRQGLGDTPKIHCEDTMKGGAEIADPEAVLAMCEAAPEITLWMERLGTVFSLGEDGRPRQRIMAGHTYPRTVFAGASTGKQLVTALVRRARVLEADGVLERRTNHYFLKLLLDAKGRCGGAILWDELNKEVISLRADAVILASGGQNLIFGKTTGTISCDGTAAAVAFTQGARLKNLEMIQYHPTTIETPSKRMLITEAARGEGGRLYYLEESGKRVYFMEDKYGEKGNLKPRDVVSKEMYLTGKQVYLDITFLGEKKIEERLSEVSKLCKTYIHLDPSKEPIPVVPCIHFFMGGLAVSHNHETTIPNLYAVGECASIYHGANRLGGNSLLAALYSGRVAAKDAVKRSGFAVEDEDRQRDACREEFDGCHSKDSHFPSMYLLNNLSEIMNGKFGIVRNGQDLESGIEDLDFFLQICRKIKFDALIDPYRNYAIKYMLLMGKAILLSAQARQESRGAHNRADYPETDPAFCAASYCTYADGEIRVSFEKDGDHA